MISIWQAIILGIVQGATEFLPVSSSGHILLAAKVLDIPTNLTAETLLNIGTIAVIAIFFRRQIWSVTQDLFGKTLNLIQKKEIVLKLTIGVVPAILVGIVFGDFIEKNLHGPATVALMLAVVGVAMMLIKEKRSIYSKEKVARESLNTNVIQEVSFKQAVIVGLVQPLALISGTSRSGVTILAGMWAGLKIETAATFSFLIGLPVILGATLKFTVSSEGLDFIKYNFGAVLFGNLASLIVGFGAIYLLMDVVKKRGLKPFGVYRIALALAVAVFILL
jgi:undecaprenyl-diphosphatase